MRKTIWILLTAIMASCSGNHEEADAWGTFEATEITVSAEVPGKIIYMNLEEGEKLESGTLVGLIDTVDWQLKKEQLAAQKSVIASKYPGVASQIAVQEQQLKNLETDKGRIERLYKEGAATKKQLDDINGSIDLVKTQILSIETQNTAVASELSGVSKQIEQMEQNLKRCHIVNPLNGTVLEKYAEPGELAAAGRALYKLADLSRMYLRVYVSGSQLPSIKTGDNADVFIDRDEDDNDQLEGEISWISSEAEFTPKIIQTKEERVNLVYAVKVSVVNNGSIKIGMPGEVNFRKK